MILQMVQMGQAGEWGRVQIASVIPDQGIQLRNGLRGWF